MSLEAALRALLPAGCGFVVGPIGDAPPSPFSEEETLIASAAPKRRREFRAGRAAAHQALAQLGCPPCPIPVRDGGDPLWPAGYVGSISHTHEIVAAAIAPADLLGGLGLDLEPDTPLDEDLVGLICRPEERANAHLAKARFVAKEAYFKALFPRARVLFDFQDIRVRLDAPDGRLDFEAVNPAAAAPAKLMGRYARAAGHILAVASFRD